MFLVWDSEGISESEDRVVESIFESVDADSDSGNDSDAKTKKRSGSHDKKQKKKSAKKKRKRSDTSESAYSISSDSSHSKARASKYMRKSNKLHFALQVRYGYYSVKHEFLPLLVYMQVHTSHAPYYLSQVPTLGQEQEEKVQEGEEEEGDSGAKGQALGT